jgi:hypothetical protein
MNIASIKDYTENYWYRGFKKMYIKEYSNNKILFSNNDIIKIENSDIYLNNKLICSDPDITIEQFLELYKYILIKKGYKFTD